MERGSDIVSLNKEGLVSSLGYWALYLAGAALSLEMGQSDGSPLPPSLGKGATLVDNMQADRGGKRDPLEARSPSPEEVQSQSLEESSGRGRDGRFLRWACLNVGLWACLVVLELLVERRSRRSCNAAFVVWTASLSMSLMLPLMLAQVGYGGLLILEMVLQRSASRCLLMQGAYLYPFCRYLRLDGYLANR